MIYNAFVRALAKTGKRIATSIALVAITTSSSIHVKAACRVFFSVRICFRNTLLGMTPTTSIRVHTPESAFRISTHKAGDFLRTRYLIILCKEGLRFL
jgi:hypothetical protein